MPFRDKTKVREYQRAWAANRRNMWFEANGPCVECKSWVQLEIHHKDPTQKTEHRIWNLCEEKRKAELAKCEVRCRGCHIKIHHSTSTGYGIYQRPIPKYNTGRDGRHRQRNGLNPDWVAVQSGNEP